MTAHRRSLFFWFMFLHLLHLRWKPAWLNDEVQGDTSQTDALQKMKLQSWVYLAHFLVSLHYPDDECALVVRSYTEYIFKHFFHAPFCWSHHIAKLIDLRQFYFHTICSLRRFGGIITLIYFTLPYDASMYSVFQVTEVGIHVLREALRWLVFSESTSSHCLLEGPGRMTPWTWGQGDRAVILEVFIRLT